MIRELILDCCFCKGKDLIKPVHDDLVVKWEDLAIKEPMINHTMFEQGHAFGVVQHEKVAFHRQHPNDVFRVENDIGYLDITELWAD